MLKSKLKNYFSWFLLDQVFLITHFKSHFYLKYEHLLRSCRTPVLKIQILEAVINVWVIPNFSIFQMYFSGIIFEFNRKKKWTKSDYCTSHESFSCKKQFYSLKRRVLWEHLRIFGILWFLLLLLLQLCANRGTCNTRL